MSVRLQVVVNDEELSRFQHVAEVSGLTLSEWVRQTLRSAERSVSTGDVERKLAVLEWAASLNLGPEVSPDEMEAEIERGALEDLPDNV